MINNPFYSKIDLITKPIKGVEVITYQKPVDGNHKPLTLINELKPYESIVTSLDYGTRTQRPYLMIRGLSSALFGYAISGTIALSALKTALTVTQSSFYLKELNDKLLNRRASMDGVNPKKYHALDFTKQDIFTAEWCYGYDVLNLLLFLESYKAERGLVEEYGKFNKPDADIYDILDEPDIRELVFRVTKALKNEFVADNVSFNRARKYLHKYVYMSAQQYIPGAVGIIHSKLETTITKAIMTASRNGMSYTIQTGTEANLHTLNGKQIGSSGIWEDLYNGITAVSDLKTAINGFLNAMQDSPSHELVRSYYRGLSDNANRNYEIPADYINEKDAYPISKDLALVNKLRYLPQSRYNETGDNYDVDGHFSTDGIYIQFGAYSPEMSYEEIIELGIHDLYAAAASLDGALRGSVDVVYGDLPRAPGAAASANYLYVKSGSAHHEHIIPPLLSIVDISSGKLMDSEEIMHTFGMPFLIGHTTPSVGPDDMPFKLFNIKPNQHYGIFDYDQATSWISRLVEELNGEF